MAMNTKITIPKMKSLANWINPPKVGVALSGGGCKAFYGLGLFSRLMELGLKVSVWGGASAGASMALTLALGRVTEVMQVFTALTSINEKNLYLSKLIQGKTPFPHENMYRTTIRKSMDWQKFQSEVDDLIIPVSKVPQGLFNNIQNNVKVFYELTKAYRLDLELREKGEVEKILIETATRLGLTEHIFRKKDIRDAQHLEDIILASSSVPPLVKFQVVDGQKYLDGGIFNNMPIRQMENVDYRLGVVYEENDLYNYQDCLKDSRSYIFFPLRKVDIAIWEYSRPDLIEETFEHGRKDAERAVERIAFLLR